MYIKMNDDKSLVITVPTTIYRGEKNADLITFLVPGEYSGKNVADCAMLMRYVLPSGIGRSESLIFQPEMYKSYLQYSTPVNTRFTDERGEIIVWLTAFDHDDNVVLKSGEVIVTVQQSKDIGTYLPPDDIDQIDKLAAKVSELESKKVDGWIFDKSDSTIQLTSNGSPVDDKIYVCTDDTVAITNVSMSNEGELIITFEDGTTQNLGVISGSGGVVYVPHMSSRKELSWTIEEASGEVPPTVDLNPFDEWYPVDGNEAVTEYVWEPM